MVGTLVRGAGVHHGVTFNFGSAKVCSHAIFETSFSYDKDIWIAATNYHNYALLHICAFTIDSYFNTMRYRSGETVQKLGYFQSSVRYI